VPDAIGPGPGADGAFAYRAGRLHAEGVDLARIADAVGTPTYVYSETAIADRYRAFAAAVSERPALVCYACKANSNRAVIASLARLGAGADIVSGGELRQALAAGVPAERIVFAGVGKTEAEMADALDAGILQFNVESEAELERLDAVARGRGRVAAVALRVNPDVAAGTHAKITTGTAENKFGIEMEHARLVAARMRAMAGVRLAGIAVHIGSQLTQVDPFRAAFERLAAFARSLAGEGHGLERLDFGGGLGVVYDRETPPALADYAAAALAAAEGFPGTLVFEPGRWMVAEAGVLLTRVLYIKKGSQKTFAILDSGMNDLIRPALYEAYHPVWTVAAPAAGTLFEPVDLVGPICESSDRLAAARPMPPLAAGDLLAVGSAGAYGAVMASSYNSRPPPAEVMVRGDAFDVVRPRPDYAAILDQDRLPRWLVATDATAARRD